MSERVMLNSASYSFQEIDEITRPFGSSSGATFAHKDDTISAAHFRIT